MYVVTGATGNTGSAVVKRLLEAGKKVRAIARHPEKLQSLVALGAEPFAADLTDEKALEKAFSGAQAVYAMVPPDLGNADYRGYQDRVAAALGSAIESNKVSHVVVLSSVGAEKPDKNGPIAGLHKLEERLRQISGLNALVLRAGYFMENTLPQVAVIQRMGVTAGPLRPDLSLAMIAVRDIGAFAGEALLQLDFKGHVTHELQGQRDLTMPEATAIIGGAIGKPDLRYQQLTSDQFHGALVQMGMSKNIADLFVEMAEGLNSGHVRALEPRSKRNTTPTSYEQFVAEEFVPAYRRQSAAA
jgi:uncharacterized protein YbjT (DUF2867 family)